VRDYRRENLARRYRLTPQEFEDQLVYQRGLCACCQKRMIIDVENHRDPDAAVVDHSHVTNELRGIICHDCNIGIGRLGDDLDGVRDAEAYLAQPNWHTNWIQEVLPGLL
jgi:hypothetical protein